VRRIDVGAVREVIWSDNGELVAIAGVASFYILQVRLRGLRWFCDVAFGGWGSELLCIEQGTLCSYSCRVIMCWSKRTRLLLYPGVGGAVLPCCWHLVDNGELVAIAGDANFYILQARWLRCFCGSCI
jgi:hypothetical protein